MNFYENMVILNASLNEDEIKAAIDKISGVVTNAGGEVLKAENWGRRKLSYELNKQKMGIYVLFLFKAPSAAIGKLEGYFKVFDPVIKFMVVRLDKRQLAALPKEAAGGAAAPAAAAGTEQKTEA
ncbi:MAG: 30S ribosomal protein S6 [Nitrospirota bacterium]